MLSGPGIVVIPDEGGAISAPLTLTEVQAERLGSDIDPRAGVAGGTLDKLAPLPAGAPPMSYLLAGWVKSSGSTSAAQARTWMGDADWTRAPELTYPWAVVALFVADMARAADAEMPPLPAGDASATTTGSQPAARGMPLTALHASGPCSAVTQFIAGTIKGLFDALRITPTTATGLFASIANTFATIWNVAVGIAQGIVQGLVQVITQKIFDAIRLALGALGVATQVLSYFSDQRLKVEVGPPDGASEYRFAVGTEADITGTFTATAPSLTGSWPPELVDCATTAGAPLPELIAPGGSANWVAIVNPQLITPSELAGTVESDRTAIFKFSTGHESEETAKGDKVFEPVQVHVRIPRKEVASFLELARNQVTNAKSMLLAQIPSEQLQQAADDVYKQTIDKSLDQLQAAANDEIGSIFGLEGDGMIVVSHHQPPDTTTSSSPPVPAPPPGGSVSGQSNKDKFCQILTTPSPAINSGIVAMGQAGLARMAELTPYAPDQLLDDIAAATTAYQAAAAGDYNGLAAAATALATAIENMYAYCGLKAP